MNCPGDHKPYSKARVIVETWNLGAGVSRCPFLGLLLLDPENSREQICYETLGPTHGDFLGTLLA